MSITIEQLRETLKYDPSTGKFTWCRRTEDYPAPLASIRAFNTILAGKQVYEENHRGYGRMTLLGRRYKSHRVAWALHTGDWPIDQVDHINGDRADNRIENLREATQRENSRNMKTPATNTSGVIGVCWDKKRRRWTAQVKVDGRTVHLGSFTNFDNAVAARAAAEVEHGFHPNHGRPALA